MLASEIVDVVLEWHRPQPGDVGTGPLLRQRNARYPDRYTKP